MKSKVDGGISRDGLPFPHTEPNDVFASLPYDGPPKSLDEMDAAIEAEVRRRNLPGSAAGKLGIDKVRAL